jgi:hypothetical protein
MLARYQTNKLMRVSDVQRVHLSSLSISLKAIGRDNVTSCILRTLLHPLYVVSAGNSTTRSGIAAAPNHRPGCQDAMASASPNATRIRPLGVARLCLDPSMGIVIAGKRGWGR